MKKKTAGKNLIEDLRESICHKNGMKKLRTKKAKSKKSKTIQFLEKTAGRKLTLGGLLESIRLGEEISGAAFARKLGLSSSHFCDIEKGRKVVSPERAAKFAKILGYSQEQFVRLSLQAILDESGLKMKVDITAA